MKKLTQMELRTLTSIPYIGPSGVADECQTYWGQWLKMVNLMVSDKSCLHIRPSLVGYIADYRSVAQEIIDGSRVALCGGVKIEEVGTGVALIGLDWRERFTEFDSLAFNWHDDDAARSAATLKNPRWLIEARRLYFEREDADADVRGNRVNAEGGRVDRDEWWEW